MCHVRLDFFVSKSPLLPSCSTICVRNGPKMARNVRSLCQPAPKPRTGHLLGYGVQIRIPRAPSPPATPHFLWFPSLRIAQLNAWTPVPVVTLVEPKGSQAPHRQGQRWVESKGREKKTFLSKPFLDHLGCSNKCF